MTPELSRWVLPCYQSEIMHAQNDASLAMFTWGAAVVGLLYLSAILGHLVGKIIRFVVTLPLRALRAVLRSIVPTTR
jgi:hypothetical protein